MGALNGGEKDKTVLTQKVRNALTTDLENEVKNINKILIENSIKVTNEVISKINSTITIKGNTSSIASFGEINMSGNAEFDLTQYANLKWVAEATQTIVNDSNVKNDLQEKITNEVLNKTINENDTMAKLNALNDILSRDTNEGGEQVLVDMVDSITSIFKPGKTTEKDINQVIDNELNILIKNKTLNQNEIKNIITAEVKNIINNITEATCSQLMNTTNQFTSRDINMSENAKFKAGQTAMSDAVSTCINTASNSVDIANKIIQNNDNFIDNDTTNENKVDAALDVENTLKAIKEKTSIINGLKNMIIVIAIIIGICVVVGAIAGVIYVAKGGKIPSLNKKLPTPLSPSLVVEQTTQYAPQQLPQYAPQLPQYAPQLPQYAPQQQTPEYYQPPYYPGVNQNAPSMQPTPSTVQRGFGESPV